LSECSAVQPIPLYREMIYLHSRKGNVAQALDLLLTKIGDPDQVIRFVETTDKALWADVIDFAVKAPAFLVSAYSCQFTCVIGFYCVHCVFA
jgi:hypothetical protein